MNKLFATVAAVALMGMAGQAQAQDKLKIGIITTLSGPPAVLGQQLRNGFQLAVKDTRRQARRPRGRADRAGRRAQARRRGRQGQGAGRARQGRLRGRPDLLQHPDRDHEAGDRQRRLPDQPERRHLELRRQGLQPELLRHLLPERPEPRGAGQVRAGHRHEEGLPAWRRTIQAGKDSLAGFKRYFKGEIADEVYVPLNQLDYSAELVAASPPPSPTRSSCSCRAAWA